MEGSNDSQGLVICACCGRAEMRAEERGIVQVRWLRKDTELGLGVCGACPEWLEAWDRGYQDVRSAPVDRAPRSPDGRPNPESMIRNASLPSFSHVLLEIYELLSSPTAGAEQIAALLQTDAALTARTLRLANSAYYASASRIATVPAALTRIGPFDLWWLLFTTEVKSLFYAIDRHLMDMERFWRHSLMVACVSRVLAERHRCGEPREMFVAGLLHDIGKLLFLQHLPIDYGGLMERAARGESLIELERAAFGFTHADIGGELLERWNLPRHLALCVRRHHCVAAPLTQENLIAQADRLTHQLEAMKEAGERMSEADDAIIAAGEKLYRRLVDLVL